MLAHMDERLVGIILDALHELLIVTGEAAYGDGAPIRTIAFLAVARTLGAHEAGAEKCDI
jgi:hypothetical protein